LRRFSDFMEFVVPHCCTSWYRVLLVSCAILGSWCGVVAPQAMAQPGATNPPGVDQPADSSESGAENPMAPPFEFSRPRPAPSVRPTPSPASPNATNRTPPLRRPAPRNYRLALARAPNMYGDFISTGEFVFQDQVNNQLLTEFLQRGVMKVGENNSAIPEDRAYFLFQNFNSVIDSTFIPLGANAATQSMSLSRYTLGVEKTFACGQWSVEARIPFYDGISETVGGFQSAVGSDGNIGLVAKRLLLQTPTWVLSAGLGLTVPTGSNAEFQSAAVGVDEVTLVNDAWRFQPFLAGTYAKGRVFSHGFLQLDVPANGNEVRVASNGGGSVNAGFLNDRPLLFLDASIGYWLSRNTCDRGVTGVAALAEIHYTAGLSDEDVVDGVTANNGQFFLFGSQQDVNVVNATLGLHIEIAQHTRIRVATITPLSEDPDRFFDHELWVSIGRSF